MLKQRALIATIFPSTSLTRSPPPPPVLKVVGPTEVSPAATVQVELTNDTRDAGACVLFYPVGGSTYVAWEGMDGTQAGPSTGARVCTRRFAAPAPPGRDECRL